MEAANRVFHGTGMIVLDEASVDATLLIFVGATGLKEKAAAVVEYVRLDNSSHPSRLVGRNFMA